MSKTNIDRPNVVYHMLPRTQWEALQPGAPYTCATLDSEGFIHCTGDADLLVQVANHHYRQEPGEWLILSIDTRRLTSTLRWEAADGDEFPHVYGVIEPESIVDVSPFPRTSDGAFMAPEFAGALATGGGS